VRHQFEKEAGTLQNTKLITVFWRKTLGRPRVKLQSAIRTLQKAPLKSTARRGL